MAEKVEIVIEAQDNASSELRGINDEIKSIGGVARAEALRDLGAAGLDAFQAMAGAASEFVDIAAESELVSTRMEAQLRALGDATNITSDQINGLATELSGLTGFDDEALVEAQTALLRFGVTSEEQFDRATRAATDLAAATGMDLSAAFTAVGVAMDTGQWGRLTKQIGSLSDAEEKALKAASKAGDTMAAQTIILDALEKKVSGAGEAIGDTWTGKMNIARVETDNLKQSIGDGLLGALNQLPQGAITAGTALGDFGSTIGTIAGPIADVAISLKALGGLGGVGVALKGAFSGIGAAATGALAPIGAAIGAITLPVWLLVAAIGALIAVWNVFGEDFKKTASMIGQIIGALAKRAGFELKQGFTNAFAGIQQSSANFIVGFTDIMAKMGAGLPVLFEDGSGALSQFLTLFGVGKERAESFGKSLWLVFDSKSGLPFLFEDGSGKLEEFLNLFGVGEEKAQAFGMIVWNAMDKIRDGFKELSASLGNIGSQFVAAGQSIVQGLWQGIQAGWSWLMDAVGGLLDSLLASVQAQLGISSPSKVWADAIGKPMALGVGAGFGSQESNISGGIGSALMPGNLAPVSASGGGGGQNIIINLPATVVADRQYVTTQLTPYVREIMRKL